MSAMSVQPLFVRVTHWVNAGAFLVMAASGLQIYNAYPIAPFRFPAWMTLGDWLGGALLWHFAAMWVFGFNLLAMLVYGLVSGRYRKRFFPLSLGAALRESIAALRGQVHHDPNRYNAVQRLLYAGVLAALTVLVLSGLSIWKPVQFQELTGLFGGFQGARLVHFLAMAGVSAFVILHVVMALLVPRTLRAMTLGR